MTQRTRSQGSAPAVVVLGTDALLTARPATPVQLAHACLAAGYTAALPVSWGDELLADALAKRAVDRQGEPMIACVCPRVAERLAESELDRFLVPLVAPPVATARYLRALYARDVHITYVGACPAAHDPAIDGCYAPGEFLARLRELGIEVEDQPVVFESVLPPDRRRFDSLPGGVPTSDCLRRAGAPHTLLELQGEDYVIAIAQQLLEREPTLLDLAPRLGCDCAGSAAGSSLRLAVGAMEPPRARAPVIDLAIAVALDAPARARPARRETPPQPAPAVAHSDLTPTPHAAPLAVASPPDPEVAPAPEPVSVGEPAPEIEAPRPDEAAVARAAPPSVPRLGVTAPRSRTPEGLVVPRAYLRRRRLGGETPSRQERMPVVPPAELERETPIAREVAVEPAAVVEPPADIAATEAPSSAPPAPPVETEVPIRRVALPHTAATDVVPPPPIMPDAHFGDSLIVADSLSELLGMESMNAPLAAPEPPRQALATPSPQPEPEPPPNTPPPAPAPPIVPELVAAPANETPVRPSAPVREQAPELRRRVAEPMRTPSATRPRTSSRALTAVVLPRRRRGTAIALWLIVGSMLALLTLGARYGVTEGVPRLTRMIEARWSPPPSTPPPAVVTPALPPVIIDSAAAVEGSAEPDSAPTADTAGATRPAERTSIAPPPSGRDTVAPRASPRTTPRPARIARPAHPVRKDEPPSRRASDAPPVTPTASLDTSVRADSSDRLRLDTPRVTKPWPPPW